MSATTVSSSSASVSNPFQTSLFQVYLRLRPPISHQPDGYGERFLIVDAPRRFESSGERGEASGAIASTHITLQPPNDSRKRAVERFAFTKVFQENASQKEIFEDTEMASLVKAVLVEGRDGLVATLGVTGSGKVCSDPPNDLSYHESLIVSSDTEPYHPRIKVPARHHADGPRCPFQVHYSDGWRSRQLDYATPAGISGCVRRI